MEKVAMRTVHGRKHCATKTMKFHENLASGEKRNYVRLRQLGQNTGDFDMKCKKMKFFWQKDLE